MSIDRRMSSPDLRDCLQADPDRFLRIVARQYNRRLKTGETPESALSDMVDRMAHQDINLPLVLDMYPKTTRHLFDEYPNFEKNDIRETALRIKDRG